MRWSSPTAEKEKGRDDDLHEAVILPLDLADNREAIGRKDRAIEAIWLSLFDFSVTFWKSKSNLTPRNPYAVCRRQTSEVCL